MAGVGRVKSTFWAEEGFQSEDQNGGSGVGGGGRSYAGWFASRVQSSKSRRFTTRLGCLI